MRTAPVELDRSVPLVQCSFMKVLRSFGVFTVIALNCFYVHAGPNADKAEPAGYRLTVELKDGSRVIGKSREERFEFHSDSLGDMRLALQKIRSVEGVGKPNEVKLITTGNDELLVEFATKDIRVETAFGEVKLPVSLIRSVRVAASGGAGRPTDGLIGLWSGDGNADDSVGGNNGNNENVQYVDGVSGKAFSFSPHSGGWGLRTCIDVPDKPEYVLTHSLTVDAWIRPRGDGNVIFTRGDRRSGMDPYTISMDGHHTVIFAIEDDKNGVADVRADNIPYGAWTHVAGTLDGDTGMVRIYTNGVLAAEKETNIRPIGELIQRLTPGIGIGNVNDGMNNFPFVGDIDEVGLYNRALTGKEVYAVYSEHAATAGGRAGLLPTRQDNRFAFQNGLGPN
jgi:hypothetical protein